MQHTYNRMEKKKQKLGKKNEYFYINIESSNNAQTRECDEWQIMCSAPKRFHFHKFHLTKFNEMNFLRRIHSEGIPTGLVCEWEQTLWMGESI